MFVLKNLIIAVTTILNIAINTGILILILNVVFNWVHADRYNRVVFFVTNAAEFIMMPLRKRFNLIFRAIDLTPIITLMILIFAKDFIIKSLFDYARTL